MPSGLPSSVVSDLRGLPVLDGAACREIGAPMWDGTLPGETPEERRDRHHAAARICRTCPARWPCAVQAARYQRDEIDGVWAARLHEPHAHDAA